MRSHRRSSIETVAAQNTVILAGLQHQRLDRLAQRSQLLVAPPGAIEHTVDVVAARQDLEIREADPNGARDRFLKRGLGIIGAPERSIAPPKRTVGFNCQLQAVGMTQSPSQMPNIVRSMFQVAMAKPTSQAF